jgi:group I intron endonuclease
MSCVYWIHTPEHTNIFQQGYVGVSKRFERRIWEHLKLAGNTHLKNAINKYGWENLVKEKVIIADENYCLEMEAKLRPKAAVGWNIIMGGGMPPIAKKGMNAGRASWNKGLAWSKEYKEKVSIGVSKLWENPEYRQAMSDAHKGQTSPMKGKKHSPESLKQMSEAKKGKAQSKETIEKRASKLRGKPVKQLTCQKCKKIGGDGAMKRWHFDNCKGIK